MNRSSNAVGGGAALAQRFASGYKVALIARSGEVIGKVSNEIRGAGGVALPIQSDATVESQYVFGALGESKSEVVN
jgi:hypothetical protein